MSPKIVRQFANVAFLIAIVSVDSARAQTSPVQTGSSSGVLLPSQALPRRELAFGLSAWQTSETVAAAAAGATYTRNLDDHVGIEAALDVGADRSRPFAIAMAQFRMNREDLPGIRQFMTFGVARAFANREKLEAPEGRGFTVGVGLQAVIRDSALRVGGQVIVFEHALAARVTCAFVKGFD
jgi:hypothetical protein